MGDEVYTSRDLADWEWSVNVLGYGPHANPGDVREAQDATANMCSAWGGRRHMPEAIYNIVRHAIESGYYQALSDVRNGRIDGLGPTDID